MIGKRHEQARLQSDFYRDQYHKMLRLITAMSFIILLEVLGIIYYVLTPAPVHYYASTTNGLIFPMAPIASS